MCAASCNSWLAYLAKKVQNVLMLPWLPLVFPTSSFGRHLRVGSWSSCGARSAQQQTGSALLLPHVESTHLTAASNQSRYPRHQAPYLYAEATCLPRSRSPLGPRGPSFFPDHMLTLPGACALSFITGPGTCVDDG